MTEQQTRVFVSYNRTQRPAARRVAGLLQSLGLTVWLDEHEISAGAQYVDELSRALEGSNAVAVLLGPDGLSGFQREEVNAATILRMQGRVRMVVALLPGTPATATANLPVFVRAASHMQFSDVLEDREAMGRLYEGLAGRRMDAAESAALERVLSGMQAADALPRAPSDPKALADAVSDIASAMRREGGLTVCVGRPMADAPAGRRGPVLDEQVHGSLAGAVAGGAAPLDAALVTLLRDTPAAWRRRAAPGRRLVVTTRSDVALERTLFRSGVSFTRVVQHRSGVRLTVSEFRDVRVEGENISTMAHPANQSKPGVNAGDPAAVDGIIARTPSRVIQSTGHAGDWHGDALRSLNLQDAPDVWLYKYHGSRDLTGSDVQSTDDFFRLAASARVPDVIVEAIANTPTLFVGCDRLEPDVRHLLVTVLLPAFHLGRHGVPRFAVSPYVQNDPEVYREAGANTIVGDAAPFLHALLAQTCAGAPPGPAAGT